MKNYLEVKENNKIGLVAKMIGLFFLSIPLDSFKVIGGFSALRIIAMLPIFAILITHEIKNIKINKILVIIGVYIFYMFAQVFYSIDMNETIGKFTTYIMYFALLFLCTQLKYNNREIKFLKKCFAYSCWTCVLCILFFGCKEEGRLTISFFRTTKRGSKSILRIFHTRNIILY